MSLALSPNPLRLAPFSKMENHVASPKLTLTLGPRLRFCKEKAAFLLSSHNDTRLPWRKEEKKTHTHTKNTRWFYESVPICQRPLMLSRSDPTMCAALRCGCGCDGNRKKKPQGVKSVTYLPEHQPHMFTGLFLLPGCSQWGLQKVTLSSSRQSICGIYYTKCSGHYFLQHIPSHRSSPIWLNQYLLLHRH